MRDGHSKTPGGVKREKYHEWLRRRWETRAAQAAEKRQNQQKR